MSVSVCGAITAYTAATAATAGSITIAGQTFTIAPGTTLVGSENLTVGATVTLNVMVDAPDTIVSGTVTVGCAAATSTATATATGTPATATTTATATSTSTTIATPPTGPPPPPTLTATAAPTDTPTVAPTNTPTATPVPTALGVFPKVVSSAQIHHLGRVATVHWKMAYQLGLKGFRIFAGKKNLTSAMIKPHKSTRYTAHVAWVKHAKYSLHVLFKSGHQRTVTIH